MLIAASAVWLLYTQYICSVLGAALFSVHHMALALSNVSAVSGLMAHAANDAPAVELAVEALLAVLCLLWLLL